MSAPTPASRYAEELLALFIADLHCFQEAMQNSTELKDFLADDGIGVKEKKLLLRQVFGDTMEHSTLTLLALLLEQGRLGTVPQIYTTAAEVHQRWSDMLAVHITTAVNLSEQEEDNLLDMLHQRYEKDIVLKKAVDPGLIAGAVLRVGNKMLDGSIKSQLNTLEKELSK